LFGLGKPQVRVRLTVNTPGGEEVLETESAASESEPEVAPAKETESQPELEHDVLLDHTESVISRLIHLMGIDRPPL
jgi:hypothetical protein